MNMRFYAKEKIQNLFDKTDWNLLETEKDGVGNTGAFSV